MHQKASGKLRIFSPQYHYPLLSRKKFSVFGRIFCKNSKAELLINILVLRFLFVDEMLKNI